MKELFEQVIALKNYDLKALLANIDQYHIEGRLTDDERQSLHKRPAKVRRRSTTMPGRSMHCGRRFVHCSRASRRPPRTNGPNSCSQPARERPTRWATR